MNKLTFLLALFCVVLSAHSQDLGFNVIEYKPAPGQHINIENIGTPQAAQNLAGDEKSLVSLGNFGGYVVLQFKKACVNHPNNPYGVDFSVFGNSFEGSSEPGIIYVMQDANNNGLPDDIWYEIAGSDYHNPTSTKNYRVNYKNPHGNFNIPWNDNHGNEGEVIANSFNTQEYYPDQQLFTDYPQDSIAFEGTKLQSSYYESSNVQIELEPLAFGYADNLPTNYYSDHSIPDNPYTLNVMEGGGGNAIDISWAVNENGNYVHLDSINFVKIVSANLQDAGIIGELSSDVTFISDVQENENLTGDQSVVVIYNHAPEVIIGDSVLIAGNHFEMGKPSGKDLSYKVDSEIGVFTDGNFIKSSVGGNVTIKAELQEDQAEFNVSSVLFREPTSIQLNTDFSAFYTGDTLALDAVVLDQNEVEIRNLSTLYVTPLATSTQLLNEGKNNSLVAINPGTDTLVISCVKFPDVQLKIPIVVQETENLANVYISIKTEQENILPLQKIKVPVSDLNKYLEDIQNDYSAFEQPTIAHAICKGLEKAGTAFSLKDDDKANGQLYLYSVEKEGFYTYGWGGKTDPSAFARAWIVRLNGNLHIRGFDKTTIKSGDTIMVYHVSNLLTEWELTTLFSSSDTVILGNSATITTKKAICSYQNNSITENEQIPVQNKEVTFKGTSINQSLFTDGDGKIEYTFNEAGSTFISSVNDALTVFVDIETGTNLIPEERLELYPNPASNYISIRGYSNTFQKIEIYSASGILEKLLLNQRIGDKIDISELSGGIYLVKVVTKDSSQSFKIFKN